MVEAAGVELDGRFKTGLFYVFPNENEILETLKSLKCMGPGTKQVHGFLPSHDAHFSMLDRPIFVFVAATVSPPPCMAKLGRFFPRSAVDDELHAVNCSPPEERVAASLQDVEGCLLRLGPID